MTGTGIGPAMVQRIIDCHAGRPGGGWGEREWGDVPLYNTLADAIKDITTQKKK